MYWLAVVAELLSYQALIFRSLVEIRKPITGSHLFLNWQLMFVLTTLQSIYFYFVTEPTWSILVCLLVNMFVVFMPAKVASLLDVKLKGLHLEILYDLIRGKLVNIGFRVYLANTRNVMGLLDEQEKRKFKELLTTFLDGDYSKPVPYFQLAAKPKTFDEKDVQCVLLQPTQLSSLRPVLLKPSRDDRIDSKNKSYERQQISYPAFEAPSNDPFRKSVRSPDIFDRARPAVPPPYPQPSQETAFTGEREAKRPLLNSGNIINSFAPIESIKEDMLFRRSATDTAFQDYKQLNHRSGKLIDELNMSVSEYSDMLDFGNDDGAERQFKVESDRKPLITTSQGVQPQPKQQPPPRINLPIRTEKKVEYLLQESHLGKQLAKQERKPSPLPSQLLAKSEAYIQMGSKTYPRLEKYYVELYSNDIMQIVSMHGRLFERHVLRSMRRQDNDYYELTFTEDSMPQSRVLKFKTDMGQFSRYIRP